MSRVFIGRLAFDAREKDVERFLRGFGRIREISIKKGYGFVVGLEYYYSVICFKMKPKGL